MTRPHRIAVATFGRSDFSILRPLCRLLDDDPRFDLGLWVGGAHFEATSGHTIEDVEKSGLPVSARIDTGSADRSPLGTAVTMAAQLRGFAAIAADDPVDLVLILGDRFEAVAAGLAMVPLGVPVGHLSGGSVTEGAIDDVFRHCLTKIASLHFCDLPQFARRIQHMGEDPRRIFTIGALGLDAFRSEPRRSFDELVDHFHLDGLRPGFALVTLHPETWRPEVTAGMAEALVQALEDFDLDVVFSYPNADPGADLIVRAIETAATRQGVYVVSSFGADWYPTVMSHAGVMAGNSSGGIIEAASFRLPVVDIGERQHGRDHGVNVVHVARDRESIRAGIARATSPEFAECAGADNIYGDGRAAERVLTVLGGLDWSVLRGPKPFVDADPAFVGDRMELTCG